MKLTDYIVEYIKKQGIDTVFGYTGGSIADLVDSIYRAKGIRFVQNYNEQASAFCTNSYAQIGEKTGVAISSSGPGAINMINGIANAYYDSIPCVFITGNVHSLSKNKSSKIRQNAFQETDIVSMVKGITKYAVYLENENDIKYELDKAFYIANEGRKGPVLIDIPYDIQRKNINENELKNFTADDKKNLNFSSDKFFNVLKEAKKPLILAGGGCQNAKEELKIFLKSINIPIVTSMRGLDLISHNCENYIGFIGSYGNRAANLAVKYCDLLVVLGSRLDERQMGYKKEEFAPNAKIIQIDIDENELGRKVDCFSRIKSDVKEFLNDINKTGKKYVYPKWLNLLNELKNEYPSIENKTFSESGFLNYLSEKTKENAVITVDVGQNQIISAQSLNIKGNQKFLCSAGLACMGYSLPAAIGAYYAKSGCQIISVNGDGGFQMNIQELQTVSRDNIPLKIVVLNNNCLGLIRKLQEKIFEKRFFASVEGYSNPNFKNIAKAYNLDYVAIKSLKDYKKLDVLNNEKPVIIEVFLPQNVSANPEAASNISDQIPLLSDKEIENIEKRVKEAEL